jgi:hypothetical protein
MPIIKVLTADGALIDESDHESSLGHPFGMLCRSQWPGA